MKDPDDLENTPASIGGAMSKWPLRTLTWACREERAEMTDPKVIDRLLETEVDTLMALEQKAEQVEIDAANLKLKRKTLADADGDRVLDAVNLEYRVKYGNDPDGCPFQQSGLDKACWMCPVAGRSMATLTGARDPLDTPEGEPSGGFTGPRPEWVSPE